MIQDPSRRRLLLFWLTLLLLIPGVGTAEWKRHFIEHATSELKGADGVRAADFNGDGWLDVVTPWEEGRQTRVYLNPGGTKVRSPWPAVTSGKMAKAEDAVAVDLDGDGNLDVVSCAESRRVHLQFSPPDAGEILDETRWLNRTLQPAPLPWMFCLPMDMDGRNGIDLVIGSKAPSGPAPAAIGWLESPPDPRTGDWRWHKLHEASWIMSLLSDDVDADGDLDIICTDRMDRNIEKELQGIRWLENPGTPGEPGAGAPWQSHKILPPPGQIYRGPDAVLFATVADLDGDGLNDVLSGTTRDQSLWIARKVSTSPVAWEEHLIETPAKIAMSKSVEVADIDLDGKLDLVVICSYAPEGTPEVWYLTYGDDVFESRWTAHGISDGEGEKFDNIALADLDHDGDLDVITAEENADTFGPSAGLGVMWFENPARTVGD